MQFHPEYLSRVLRPSVPDLGFVAASSGCLEEMLGKRACKGQSVGMVDSEPSLVNGMEGVGI